MSQSKTLKAQFNRMCVAGIMLDMNSVSIYTGVNGLTCFEVNSNGINLQPGMGNPISLSSYVIKGPLYRNSSVPADYLPGPVNLTPRKYFDFTLADDYKGMAAASAGYVALVGV